MALTVLWTTEAKQNLETITQYLREHWTERELQQFYRRLENRLEIISGHPKAFRLIDPNRNVRGSVLTPQTTIFYTVYSDFNQIKIQSVFDTRQDPNTIDL